ncbi:unnamed protein product (macronuclear) [Paramecium tetraurelia]|uniref:Intraflagellar transport protein 57 n=1 Tax=Paramecium tetraurelia TaxID=5888 RepID=A0C6M8_PARTE|nr:uncharacterized protein GSPATT00035574001 [Paramecium tetraurelia]CAK66445.1 unnamed protein product [Paramecium tetraurelia]|eukprot:XP_001433842.1 hypothetical protein (macronuclear) [Paramecium tetraurelia strain d4-2]
MSEQQSGQDQLDVTAMMDELYDKLILLNYEQSYLKQKGGKPLNRAYFVNQTNSSEQFNQFKTLVKWLFQQNDVQTSDFNKLDDPVTLSQNIINELKNIGIEVDFPPIKLKQGFGEYVVYVLLQLATKALQKKKFQYKKAKIEQQSQTRQDDEPVQETGSVSSDSDPDVASEEEPEDVFTEQGFQKDEDKMVIESNVNPKEWAKEVERAAQKIKIVIKPDAGEWRQHFDATKQYSNSIKTILPEARIKLERISDELGEILDRITKREYNINENMSEMCLEFKKKNEEYKKIELQYQNYTNAKKEMTDQYKQIQEKFETVQNKLNEHGSVSTNQSPVISIKASLTKLRLEIKQMDLRIGVLSHTILQRTFHDAKAIQERDYHENGLILNESDEFTD